MVLAACLWLSTFSGHGRDGVGRDGCPAFYSQIPTPSVVQNEFCSDLTLQRATFLLFTPLSASPLKVIYHLGFFLLFSLQVSLVYVFQR